MLRFGINQSNGKHLGIRLRVINGYAKSLVIHPANWTIAWGHFRFNTFLMYLYSLSSVPPSPLSDTHTNLSKKISHVLPWSVGIHIIINLWWITFSMLDANKQCSSASCDILKHLNNIGYKQIGRILGQGEFEIDRWAVRKICIHR